MKILLSARHRYPAYSRIGMGAQPVAFPSGSAFHLQDLLARGLAEAGHEVHYLLEGGASEPLPPGVTLATGIVAGIDIYHTIANTPFLEGVANEIDRSGTPWISSCHLDVRLSGNPLTMVRSNWVFVSKAHADTHNSSRYVLNGLDPADYVYQEQKSDYLLFMSAMERWEGKGLKTALRTAREAGRPLLVAGTARKQETIDLVSELCREYGAEYLGDVRGDEKARLLAGAAALLFPSELNEGCPLVLIEALMSGTPAISGCGGGCVEVTTPETGFLCRNEAEFVEAVSRLDHIAPERCRDRAHRYFHYKVMTESYLREYEAEIASSASGRPTSLR